jgi:hypothetical protein
MMCSLYRNCGLRAVYFTHVDGLIAFACQMHTDEALGAGVPAEEFTSLPDRDAPSPLQPTP